MPQYILRNQEVITVDSITLERMKGYTWNRRHRGGVSAIYRDKETKKTAELSLYNLMLGVAPEGMVRIHLDGDRGNFLPENIGLVPKGKHSMGICGMTDLERRGRAIERSQKRYIGTYAYGGKFRAKIAVDKKQRHLGTFATEEEAARAYDDALVELGYSKVNFSDEAAD